MSISKTFSAAVLILTSSAATASAADVVFQTPPAPAPTSVDSEPHDWSGFYLGGQAGAAFTDEVNNPLLDNDGAPLDGLFNQPDDGIDFFTTDSEDGFTGGIHAGYDHQMGNFLLGGVVDASYVDISETRGVTTLLGNTSTVTREIDFLATARLRGGITAGRFLAYGTGGLAYATVKQNFISADVPGLTSVVDRDEDELGYTVGAGAEFLASNNLSFGMEYLYTNIGNDDSRAVSLNGAGTVVSVGQLDDDVDFHTIWLKTSFRF